MTQLAWHFTSDMLRDGRPIPSVGETLTMHDAIITNHHSILLVRPLNEAACKWLRDHTNEDAQWFGGALVVEPRYLPAICDAMENDGLVLA